MAANIELEKLKKELILDFCSYKLWKEFKRGSKMSDEYLKILRDQFIRNQNVECSKELQKKLHCTRFICGLSESKRPTEHGNMEPVSSLHPVCLAHAQGICSMYPFATTEQQHFQNVVKMQIILTNFRNGKIKKAQELFSDFYDEDASNEEEYQEDIRELLQSDNDHLQKQILQKFPYDKFLREVASFLKPAMEKYDIPFMEKNEESLISADKDRIPSCILKIYHDYMSTLNAEETESSWDSIINKTHPDVIAFEKRRLQRVKTKEPVPNHKTKYRKVKEALSRSKQKNVDSKTSSEDDNSDRRIEGKTQEVISKLKSSSKELGDYVQSRKKLHCERSLYFKKRWNQHQDNAETIEWSDSDDDNLPRPTGLSTPKRCLDISLPKPTKRRKKNPWSEEELSLLIKGVEAYGAGNWSLILKMYDFNGLRTSVDLKDKWRNYNRF